METLQRREWPGAILVTVGLGGLLAAGFVPTAASLYMRVANALGGRWLDYADWGSRVAFPALALVFHLSLPARAGERKPLTAGLARTAILPIAIAFLSGLFRPGSSPWVLKTTGGIAWYFILAPFGEEWLFRGWFYDLCDRRWAGRFASRTNPFPVAVWLSSIAFSLWHLQNAGLESTAAVAFQVLYTFWTGMWLGYLRWKTGSLAPGCIAHMTLNLAASVP